MSVQKAGIFTLDHPSAARDRVALISELRRLLEATIPGPDGDPILMVEDPLRASIVDALRDALEIAADTNSAA